MKVALFIDSLGTGGAQRQIVNLAIGIKRSGGDPVIIFYNKKNYYEKLLEENEIPVKFFKRRNIIDPLFIIDILFYLKKNNISHGIAFLLRVSGYALLVKMLYPKFKLVVSERSFEALIDRVSEIFPRKLYPFATAITANSNTQTLVLKEKFKSLSHKISFVPNGVYLQKYVYNPNSNEVKIVAIGRVSDLKDTYLLLSTLNKLVRNGITNVKVEWIGALYEWNEHQTEYYEKCEKFRVENNLQDYWEWIGQVDNVNDYLRKASLLVHMSKGEGFPNALCEAMSLGIPVVASDFADHGLIVTTDINGYLVKMKDGEGLYNSIVKFIELTEEKRKTMSKNAYSTAIEKFSLEKMTENYLTLLQ